jgi:hypothetical protein
MRWEVHVARMRRRGTHIEYWLESQKERDHQKYWVDDIKMDLREIK